MTATVPGMIPTQDPDCPAARRALDLAKLPTEEIPASAVKFFVWLCQKHGDGAEVLVAACMAYANIEEGLELTFGLSETVRSEWHQVQRTLVQVTLPDGRIQVASANA